MSTPEALSLTIPFCELQPHEADQLTRLALQLHKEPCTTQGNEPCIKVNTTTALCSRHTIELLDLIRILVWRNSNSLCIELQ